jgi:CRISPR-associated protein Cmr5
VSPLAPAPGSTPASSPEQRRAAHALRVAKEVKALDEPMQKAYRSYVERIGTTIITNGLGQALATELAAAGGGNSEAPQKRAHRELYVNLQSWLCRDSGVLRGSGGDRRDADLLDNLVSIPQSDYLRVQAEALAWLVWHKKLCRAFLPRGNEE